MVLVKVGVAAGVTSEVGSRFGLRLAEVKGYSCSRVKIGLRLGSISVSIFFPLGHFYSFQVLFCFYSFLFLCNKFPSSFPILDLHIRSPAGTGCSTCKCTFHSPGPGNSDQEACGVRKDVPGYSGVDGSHRSWSVPACAPAPSSGTNWTSCQWPSGQGRRRR